MANTQQKAVSNYLKRNKSITSKEAFNRFGCTRLSALIYKFRHEENMNIVTENQTTKNRYGNLVNYAKYKLIE